MLGDMVAIFRQEFPSPADDDFISSKDMVTNLRAYEDGHWAEWKDGSGLTTHRLARMLRPLKVRPVKLVMVPKRGYERATVDSVWERVG